MIAEQRHAPTRSPLGIQATRMHHVFIVPFGAMRHVYDDVKS